MRSAESQQPFTLAAAATLACVWEATAPKPGNVHRGADFDDVTYLDFIQSAIVVGPVVGRGAELGVGGIVREGVRVTREAVGTNTNLGTLLLIAPLACVPEKMPLEQGIRNVLDALTFEDTRRVYEAIRMASAGGLGRSAEADVREEPPAGLSLVDAMRMAADRDLVARQYTQDYADVLRIAAWIEEGLLCGWYLGTSIVHAHVRQLAEEPDSLVLRKCGAKLGGELSARAARVLESGRPGEECYERELADFDFWLRSDGHRRNPGTTADLIAAGLFVLLRGGRLDWKVMRSR